MGLLLAATAPQIGALHAQQCCHKPPMVEGLMMTWLAMHLSTGILSRTVDTQLPCQGIAPGVPKLQIFLMTIVQLH